MGKVEIVKNPKSFIRAMDKRSLKLLRDSHNKDYCEDGASDYCCKKHLSGLLREMAGYGQDCILASEYAKNRLGKARAPKSKPMPEDCDPRADPRSGDDASQGSGPNQRYCSPGTRPFRIHRPYRMDEGMFDEEPNGDSRRSHHSPYHSTQEKKRIPQKIKILVTPGPSAPFIPNVRELTNTGG